MLGTTGELEAAWQIHGDDPERVAHDLPGLIERCDAGEISGVVSLVVHVLGEHLGRFGEGLTRVAALEARHGPSDPLHRSAAVFHLCAEDRASADRCLDRIGSDRVGSEVRVLATAAGCAAVHGAAGDAARWLSRAASLAATLPDDHASVRVLAISANNISCALEERFSLSEEERVLLRSAASWARAAWERAGGWLEVERAEYRLAMANLVLGEPRTAVVHAEACLAICQEHDAGPFECMYAEEAVARSRYAAGDREGAREARDRVADLIARVEDGGAALDLLARLDGAFEE